MGLTVYWTDFAKNELKNIFTFHHEKVHLKIARQIVRQIVERADDLSNFPYAGAVEEHLQGMPQNFRYVLRTNYKIIYWINQPKNRIEIVDVFDTRQNPAKMKRSTHHET